MTALSPMPAALDPRSLTRLRVTLGSEESFQGLLHDFMSSSASLSRQLHAGLAGGSAEDVARAAHTLKSMARLLGAAELGDTCRQVESLASGPQAGAPPALLIAALDQLAATRRAVGTMMT